MNAACSILPEKCAMFQCYLDNDSPQLLGRHAIDLEHT